MKGEDKMKKTLSPKLDVVFQALFGETGSERITKNFLETILNKKIEKIDLSKNPILRRDFKDDKLGVLDILAELDGKEKCNIEMQLVNSKSIIERILYYWSRLYSRQISSTNLRFEWKFKHVTFKRMAAAIFSRRTRSNHFTRRFCTRHNRWIYCPL